MTTPSLTPCRNPLRTIRFPKPLAKTSSSRPALASVAAVLEETRGSIRTDDLFRISYTIFRFVILFPDICFYFASYLFVIIILSYCKSYGPILRQRNILEYGQRHILECGLTSLFRVYTQVE